MSRYTIAPEAIQDLDEIGDYFLSRNCRSRGTLVSGFQAEMSIASSISNDETELFQYSF